MIQRLYVDNFKTFVNFELTLGPLNLILGANGSGKSTFFEVVDRLRAFVYGEGKAYELFAAYTLTRWDTRDTQTFEIDCGVYRYQLQIQHVPESEPTTTTTPPPWHLRESIDQRRRSCRIRKELLVYEGKRLYESDGERAQLYRDDGTEGPQVLCDGYRSGLAIIQRRHDNTRLAFFKDWFNHFRPVGINPLTMSPRTEMEAQFPNQDLSNFASWYRFLSQERQREVFELAQVLREDVLPEFDEFRLAGDAQGARILTVRLRTDEGSSPGKSLEYRYDELSAGQKALIGLYALLYCAFDQGNALCLDHPENFVALPEIQPWLLRLIEKVEASGRQAILVTHHPELINLLASHNGLWFERTHGGPTRVSRISEDKGQGLPIAELVARGWLHGEPAN